MIKLLYSNALSKHCRLPFYTLTFLNNKIVTLFIESAFKVVQSLWKDTVTACKQHC